MTAVTRPGTGLRVLAAAVLTGLVAACAPQAGPATPTATPSASAAVEPGLRAMLPDEVREDGTLLLVTDPTYAPATFYAPDGRTITGFDIDIARGVADRLGLELEVEAVAFSDILDQVSTGRADLGMAAITDTEERAQKVDFVDYFSAGTSIIVQRGNPGSISDVDDLCGKVVAAAAGTVQVDLLERNQQRCGASPILIRQFESQDDSLLELRTGRAAAVLNDYPRAAYLATDTRTRANYQMASDVQYEPGVFGLVVAKDSAALRDAVAATLEQMIETGAYEDVLEHWGVQDGAVQAVTVNAGEGSG